jgi:threonine dehydrogenase-like Zn-dependent dehydrogenase
MAWQYWTTAPGEGTWRETADPSPAAHQLVVRTLVTGVSKGTETLVHRGLVPTQVAELMRSPHQLGDFPFPVSYGYLNVGLVESGPEDWRGRRVFGLFPHHTRYAADPAELHPIPEDVPTERAVLAGPVETAVNILWQVPPAFADRVAVIGGGMIGLSVALLASRMPLQRLQLLEPNPARRALARSLGLDACAPESAEADNDITIHTSATASGLSRGLEITGDDGCLIEASWYGAESPRVPLGADFHARRLSIIASQVGQVAAGKRSRRTTSERMATALAALRDSRFDALLTGRSPRHQLPEVMDGLAGSTEFAASTVCHVIDFRSAGG